MDAQTGTNPSDFDALLLVGFGGPEGPDDVMAFLETVTKGRGVPRDRLEAVAEHYFARGGRSPINDQMRGLQQRLAALLGDELPVYWGNRNWHPFLSETVRKMAADGIKTAVAFAPSAYSSYSGCRQYRENIDAAVAESGQSAMAITKLRPFYDHPNFVAPFVDALRGVDQLNDPATAVLFSAHSIPSAMAASCDYEAQLLATSAEIAKQAGLDSWELVYQSRSGPPQMPWLEPDVVEAIEGLPATVARVVVVPVGFCTDHMEVLQDLDTDAAAAAAKRGADFVRIPTPGEDPRFVEMVVELIDEQRYGTMPRSVGTTSVRPTPCAEGCCPAPVRRGS